MSPLVYQIPLAIAGYVFIFVTMLAKNENIRRGIGVTALMIFGVFTTAVFLFTTEKPYLAPYQKMGENSVLLVAGYGTVDEKSWAVFLDGENQFIAYDMTGARKQFPVNQFVKTVRVRLPINKEDIFLRPCSVSFTTPDSTFKQ
ncbi:MAG: hypothetical protein Q7R98_03005 [Candidatus Jorgensenbacteria bacterium]|nr:hypothetical protein [Candidatus Jorgensenbacteria bacterium]